MVEHYFVAAWLPPTTRRPREFYARKLDGGLYRAGMVVPVGTIAPGATGEIKVPLYVGPQEQDVLAKLAKGLDLVVDYGIFTVIAAPLFWLLKWLHGSSQLGLGDHAADDHHQERVLSAQSRERALDGEDEGRSRRR
jgi:YidC/Oxa1 family membrane protein insertase